MVNDNTHSVGSEQVPFYIRYENIQGKIKGRIGWIISETTMVVRQKV